MIPISGLKAQVAVGDGSVGAPSISFSADSNTGFYRPEADTVGVVTGGVERMRVRSDGRVGIGTTVANEALTVVGNIRGGATDSTAIYLTNKEVKWRGDGQAHYSVFNENSLFSIRNTSGNWQVGTAGTTLLAIDTAGNVGIGITNPQVKLHSSGTFIGYPHMTILKDVKASGVQGGDANAGWVKRTLNTVDIDMIGVNLSNNAFTLPIGTYHIRAQVPAHRVNRHFARLTNNDNTVTYIVGTSEYDNTNYGSHNVSYMEGVITLSTSTTLAIHHWINTTRTGDGLGVGHLSGLDSTVFTIVTIVRIA